MLTYVESVESGSENRADFWPIADFGPILDQALGVVLTTRGYALAKIKYAIALCFVSLSI